jgi:hypothetical protein
VSYLTSLLSCNLIERKASRGVRGLELLQENFERDERMEELQLPSTYYLDESDPDILILRRQDDTFVAAFSAQGATREDIVEAAMEDYKTLNARKLADEDEEDATDS